MNSKKSKRKVYDMCLFSHLLISVGIFASAVVRSTRQNFTSHAESVREKRPLLLYHILQ